MVPTFLYCLHIFFPILGFSDYCDGICAADTMSERWLQHSSPGYDSGSGRPDLVSCDGSRSPEASRDYLSGQSIQVEDVVCPLAAWYSVLFGARYFVLDRRSRYVAASLGAIRGLLIAIWNILTVRPSADALLSAESVASSISMSALSPKAIIGIPIFILASGIQHDCHAYLASLPKYTLPIHPIFQSFICPHYTAECLLYLSLAFIAAPQGALINRTMFTAFVFVSANLTVTAATSKEWYERKFGKEAVAHRWIMVPGLY